MKKWIIAAAIVLTSVSAVNAEGIKCEIVQVLPGFFLPQCESYDRYVYRSHYWDNHDRWGHERGRRHNRYAGNHTRHDREYYGKKRHPNMDRPIHDGSYRRDNHRW